MDEMFSHFCVKLTILSGERGVWLQDIAWLCVTLGAVEFHSSARPMVHLVPGITTSLLWNTAANMHGWSARSHKVILLLSEDLQHLNAAC